MSPWRDPFAHTSPSTLPSNSAKPADAGFTSALIAIPREGPEGPAIAQATDRRMSAANWLEAAVVIDGSRDPIASRRFDELVNTARIVVVPVTEQQAELARAAYRDFGKGSGHPAGLNFGDCFAYALAKDFGEELLFKGHDFTHTDITPALKTGDPA